MTSRCLLRGLTPQPGRRPATRPCSGSQLVPLRRAERTTTWFLRRPGRSSRTGPVVVRSTRRGGHASASRGSKRTTSWRLRRSKAAGSSGSSRTARAAGPGPAAGARAGPAPGLGRRDGLLAALGLRDRLGAERGRRHRLGGRAPRRSRRSRASSTRQIATGSRHTISDASDQARIEKWWWPSTNENASGTPKTSAQSTCLRNVISVSRVLASPLASSRSRASAAAPRRPARPRRSAPTRPRSASPPRPPSPSSRAG